MHRFARTKAGRLSAVGALLTTLITLIALPFGASSAVTATRAADDKGTVQPELAAAFEKSTGEPQEFWVILDDAADTSSAAGIQDWGERGRAVYDVLRAHAKASQADVLAELDAAGATYTSYWITNAVHVEAGSYALAQSLAGVTGVETVRAPVAYEQVEPIEKELAPSKMGPNAEAAVEWGVANIKADQVWDTYGVRGDGIVIGSIDTGAQYDHPALISSYRGYRADGTVSHDYNWFDVTGGSDMPVDGHGHGTHTIGTMTGDDGAANRTGVAPGASWISANGCCPSDAALLGSAQWMLAPTKVDGTSPDPAKRPNIINNSWGSTQPSNDPFMEDVLQAWADSGIFGVWANGNLGPNCNTSGAPGSRTMNYSVGNYAANDTIAPSSSRGSGQDGETKPNISAPGTNVRSAYPGSSYATMTGTSMAAPHTAGAVALLYHADPTLIGDLAATRQALDGTARDTADDQCGGTAHDNNVYGEGRLDALTLVESVLEQGTSGSLTGTVTDAERQVAVPGAAITLTSGELVRSTRQGESGGYAVTIPAGEYTMTVTAFGYEPSTTTVTVTDGQTTTHDIALTPLPGGTVSGRVVDPVTGAGLPEAVVTLAGVPFVGRTDATGAFAIEKVPGPKRYVLSVNAGLCGARVVSRSLEMGGTDAVVPTITMPRHPIDVPYGTSYGYSCVTETSDWTPGDKPLVLAPVDASGQRPVTGVDLPFPFRYHGRLLETIGVQAPGKRGPGVLGASLRFCLDEPRWIVWTPDATCPSASDSRLTVDKNLIPRTEDLSDGNVFTGVHGTAPNRAFTIEWRDYTYFNSDADFDIAVTLHENGDIVVAGHDIDPNSMLERAGAYGDPVQFRSPIGGPTLLHCCTFDDLYAVGNESGGWPWRSDATQMRIDLPDAGTVSGAVTDDRTGDPVADAVVKVQAPDGTVQWQVQTDEAGRYTTEIFTNRTYTVTAYKPRAYGRGNPVAVNIRAPGARARADISLASASPTVRLTTDASGQTATLRNDGNQAYEWSAALDVPGTSPAEAGSLLKVTDLNANGYLTAIEEGGGSWWAGLGDSASKPRHEIREYTTDGDPTGIAISMPAIAERIGLEPDRLLPNDLAYIDATQEVCFTVVGDGGHDALQVFNDIVCADSRDGGFSRVIRTDIPDSHLAWSLAYDEIHDRLFLQHWHRDEDRKASGEALGIQVSTLVGPSSSQAGGRNATCRLYGVPGDGLAYQAGSQSLWKLERSASRVPILSQIDPATCTELAWRRTDNPPGGPARGTDIRPDGTLLAAELTGRILEFATGDDDAASQPWLKLSQDRGTLAPGGTASIAIQVDESRIPEGVEQVDLVLRGNGGKRSQVRVPIRLRESQQTDTSLSVTATPTTVRVGGSTKVKVKVNTTSGVTPTGQVSVSAAGAKTVRATLVDGAAVLTLGPLTTAGRVAVTARYVGDAWNRASSRSLTLTVAAKPRLRLSTHTVTLRGDRAFVGLRCAGTYGRCTGAVVIKKGGVPVARGTVSLAAGTSRIVKLRLTAKGRSLLREGRRVRAVLVLPSPSGPSRVSVTLKPVRR